MFCFSLEISYKLFSFKIMQLNTLFNLVIKIETWIEIFSIKFFYIDRVRSLHIILYQAIILKQKKLFINQ